MYYSVIPAFTVHAIYAQSDCKGNFKKTKKTSLYLPALYKGIAQSGSVTLLPKSPAGAPCCSPLSAGSRFPWGHLCMLTPEPCHCIDRQWNLELMAPDAPAKLVRQRGTGREELQMFTALNRMRPQVGGSVRGQTRYLNLFLPKYKECLGFRTTSNPFSHPSQFPLSLEWMVARIILWLIFRQKCIAFLVQRMNLCPENAHLKYLHILTKQ